MSKCKYQSQLDDSRFCQKACSYCNFEQEATCKIKKEESKSKKQMKLTAIFRGCHQDGIEHWSNYAITKDIPLTEEQEKLLTPLDGAEFSELILEGEKEKNHE